MFKLPTEFLVDKEIAAKNVKKWGINLAPFIEESNSKNGGIFFFPRMGKKEGAFFLVRAAVVDGWNRVNIQIPTEARSATHEEIQYIKTYFWNADEVVAQYYTGDLWISKQFQTHLWQPVDGWDVVPKFKEVLAPQPFWVRVRRRLRRIFKRKKK